MLKLNEALVNRLLTTFEKAVDNERVPHYQQVFGMVNFDTDRIALTEDDLCEAVKASVRKTLFNHHNNFKQPMSAKEMVYVDNDENTNRGQSLDITVFQDIAGARLARIETLLTDFSSYIYRATQARPNTTIIVFAYCWNGKKGFSNAQLWVRSLEDIAASLLTTNQFKL